MQFTLTYKLYIIPSIIHLPMTSSPPRSPLSPPLLTPPPPLRSDDRSRGAPDVCGICQHRTELKVPAEAAQEDPALQTEGHREHRQQCRL